MLSMSVNSSGIQIISRYDACLYAGGSYVSGTNKSTTTVNYPQDLCHLSLSVILKYHSYIGKSGSVFKPNFLFTIGATEVLWSIVFWSKIYWGTRAHEKQTKTTRIHQKTKRNETKRNETKQQNKTQKQKIHKFCELESAW